MDETLDVVALVRQVKAQVYLEDIVRGYGVDLVGRGKRLEGHCPFPGHEDGTPSFNVYTKTQRYMCYGCDRGGDVIDFVRAMSGCSFLQACERLLGNGLSNGETHVPVKQQPPPSREHGDLQRADQQEVLTAEHVAILTRAMVHYHKELLTHSEVLAYLSSRGASLRTVKRCLLGYVDGSLRRDLASSGLIQVAEEVGLLTSDGREWLSGRLIIPEIVDGQCAWMIGRKLPMPVPQRVHMAGKKYLGLPLEKPLLGYGRALALLRIAGKRPPLHAIQIVEGAIDYVIAQEWSLPFYTLSLLGTHASRDHLARLLDLHDRTGGLPFLVNLDGDERGGDGALRLMKQLAGYPVVVGPQIALGKDLGALAERSTGYSLFAHALGSLGEGGEWQ
jgi:DNA primase